MIDIIYLNYFQNLMIQRPHQLLKQFGRSGYNPILYNLNEKNKKMVQSEENYMIYNGAFPALPKKNKRILWISYPPLYKQIGRYDEDLLVYDCIDYPGEHFAHWRRGEQKLKEKADIIFVSSNALYDYNKAYREKTFLCKNGVDFDQFAKKRRCKVPADMVQIGKPVIGYIGAVAEWIDWKLIQYLASTGRFSLVFVGPLFGLKQIPIASKNVYFLGRKEYGLLADYLSCFDVCIIPFKRSKITNACNPIKMYEYLSMGKPVVATDIEECRIDMVRTAKTYQEFYENIVESLTPQSGAEIEKRVSFARENSWESRVKEIRSRIEPLLF